MQVAFLLQVGHSMLSIHLVSLMTYIITYACLFFIGVLGSPKTCLHAILQVLNSGVDTQRGPSCITEAPHFAELSYKLIYHLCANKDTSMPTLRYLRTTHDFLYQHLQHMPFRDLVAMEIEEGTVSPLRVMNQQSWLLKTTAIELKIAAQSRQRSHTQRLLGLLLKEPSTLLAASGISKVGNDS